MSRPAMGSPLHPCSSKNAELRPCPYESSTPPPGVSRRGRLARPVIPATFRRHECGAESCCRYGSHRRSRLQFRDGQRAFESANQRREDEPGDADRRQRLLSAEWSAGRVRARERFLRRNDRAIGDDRGGFRWSDTAGVRTRSRGRIGCQRRHRSAAGVQRSRRSRDECPSGCHERAAPGAEHQERGRDGRIRRRWRRNGDEFPALSAERIDRRRCVGRGFGFTAWIPRQQHRVHD